MKQTQERKEELMSGQKFAKCEEEADWPGIRIEEVQERCS